MATTALGTVLHNLRCCLLRDGAADGELLECFAAQRDEAAFETLLRRHGPMVLGVCRRILRNESDAEDAFQATFMVLVRKASSIRPRGMVGNWLYGVAHTTALKAKAMSSKRAARERHAPRPPEIEVSQGTWERLESLLDQEMKDLPEHYRAAIVLCDLEGKSIKDAARHLGCPMGTVGTRLARGRVLLSQRLTRHGLAFSAGALASTITQNAAAALSPQLVNSTTKAASLIAAGETAALGVKVAALSEGVIKAMFLSKIKMAGVALVAFAAILVGSSGLFRTQAADKQDIVWVSADPPEKKADEKGPKKDEQKQVDKNKAFKAFADAYAFTAHDHAHHRIIRKEGGWWKFQDCADCHRSPWGDDEPKDKQGNVAGLTEQERKELFRKLTVGAAVHDLERALDRLRAATADPQTEIAVLDEIEKALKKMRENVKQKKE